MSQSIKRLIMILLLLTLSYCSSMQAMTMNISTSNGYWPGNSWRISTPEEQGIDSEWLLQMFQAIQKDNLNIHSVLIIRNGYLVCEGYFAPYHRDMCHQVYSATKSVISALTGVAVKEKYISNINQRVLDFFPEKRIAYINSYKKEMTLKNLLSMNTGHTADSSNNFTSTDNWIQSFLDFPVNVKPGNQFLYDSGAPHILSGILQKMTGKNTLEYAQEKLFAPLGISNLKWDHDKMGIYIGGWGLSMRPLDMAKFGYLFLNHGVWNGEQIIPEQWVQESIQGQNDPTSPWNKSWQRNYGYLWWLNEFGGYNADGMGGQFIFVMPEQNTVIVMTGGLEDPQRETAVDYLRHYIIPSIKSKEPLPANPEKYNALKNICLEIENPKSKEIQPFAALAQKISGRTYKFASNPLQWYNLSATFVDKKCWFVISDPNVNKGRFEVGLDGIYRRVKTPYGECGMKGYWKDDRTFVLLFQFFDSGDLQTAFFDFTNNQLNLKFISAYYGTIANVNGKTDE